MTTTNHECQILMNLESYVNAVTLHLVIVWQYRDCYVRHLRRVALQLGAKSRPRVLKIRYCSIVGTV